MAWIFYATSASLFFGLGNTVYGLHCSQLGFWGACLTGPVGLILSAAYRLIESCRIKRRSGTFIEMARSNYWQANTDRALNVSRTFEQDNSTDSDFMAVDEEFTADET